MQLLEHYLRLVDHLPHVQIGQGVPITLGDIAEVLCCTERNGKLTIKKMEETHWLSWQPGRGRGNYSVLTLLIQPEDILLGKAQELVQKGEIRAAISLIHDYTSRLPVIRDRFNQWLHSHFGYRVETQSNQTRDTLRTFFDYPILLLDPAHVLLRSECHMVKQIFDCLVRYQPDTQSIEPHIAHFWEHDETYTEWTFYLRKGVLFHHGRELTARDVVFTLNRLRSPMINSAYRWMFAGITHVRALTDRVVQITLQQPNHLLLHFLSNEHASIIPHDYCEEMGQLFTRLPVGTGPFKLIRNDESMMVFEAFTPYFRERAFLDRIEIWIMPHHELTEPPSDPARCELRYQPYQAVLTRTNDQEHQTATAMEKGLQFLTFNLGRTGPHQLPAFREAFYRLLDRQRMVDELGGGRAEPAYGLHPDTEQVEVQDSDQSGVLRLLQEIGYSGETLRLYTHDDPEHIEDVEWIQAQCQNVGITVEASYWPFSELAKSEVIREADLILDGGTVGDNLEFSYLDLLLTPSCFLYEHLGPELRPLVEQSTAKALASPCPEERKQILWEIERQLLAKRMLLPLYRVRQSVAAPSHLHGVTLNAQGWVDYHNLWFKNNKKYVPTIRKSEYT